MVNFSLPDADVVTTIFEAAMGFRVSGLERWVHGGQSNDLWRVETDNGIFALRINAAAHYANFSKEAWVLNAAAQRGIPVPQTLKCGVGDIYAYAIASWIPDGKIPETSQEKRSAWKTLGGYSRILHSIETRGCGTAMTSPGIFASTWTEWIESDLGIIFRSNDWLTLCGVTDVVGNSLRNRSMELIKKSLPLGISCMDLCCENTLLSKGTLYLLDMEFAINLPSPLYQFAFVGKGWGYRTESFDAFTEGYGISAPELEAMRPALETVMALMSIRSVRWAQDRRPSAIEGNAIQTKNLLRQLSFLD